MLVARPGLDALARRGRAVHRRAPQDYPGAGPRGQGARCWTGCSPASWPRWPRRAADAVRHGRGRGQRTRCAGCCWRSRSTAPTAAATAGARQDAGVLRAGLRPGREPRRTPPARAALDRLERRLADRRRRGRPSRCCGPAAALRAADGEVGRGHRVLPLPPAAGAERGRRRARQPGLRAGGVPPHARPGGWSIGPDSMLATATHDTKRGEDARARLAGAERDAGGVGGGGRRPGAR